MCSRKSLALLVIIVSVILLTSGCMSSKKKTAVAKKVYVNPCNVAGKGVQVSVRGDSLVTDTVKPELQMVFVDNFNHPAAGETMKLSYELDCYWGNKVGEKRDYYYCAGQYNAPELDEGGVIKRFMYKEFKLGFSVEEHNVGTWVDSAGNIHNEGAVYYLTVREVNAKCYLGQYKPKSKRARR